MIDFKIGNVYKDIEAGDVIKITDINNGRVYFDVLDDPDEIWIDESDDLGIQELSKYDYRLEKVLNSPLYKVLND
jgi:hypothetical protein